MQYLSSYCSKFCHRTLTSFIGLGCLGNPSASLASVREGQPHWCRCEVQKGSHGKSVVLVCLVEPKLSWWHGYCEKDPKVNEAECIQGGVKRYQRQILLSFFSLQVNVHYENSVCKVLPEEENTKRRTVFLHKPSPPKKKKIKLGRRDMHYAKITNDMS